MIIYPAMNELMEKVDCKYTLVVLASRRARQLVSGDAPLIEQTEEMKPVTMAVNEIYEDKVTYERRRAQE